MAALAGKSTDSSTFDGKRADLKKRGLIDYGPSTTKLTESGRALATPVAAPLTPAELVEQYKTKIFSTYQALLLTHLVEAGLAGMTREELGIASGKSTKSSTFDGAVSGMRAAGAIEYTSDKRIRVKAALLG
jgi:hypothetical protein